MNFNDWKRRGKNTNGDEMEYYEDTHNENGDYVGRNRDGDYPKAAPDFLRNQVFEEGNGGAAARAYQPAFNQPQYSARPEAAPPDFALKEESLAVKPAQNTSYTLPNKSQFISPRNYQNVIVYEPKSPDDVQTLIDYLKRREPAIINLDKVNEEVAQRILDFVSGAVYALNGSVHRIAGNIFLLSPEGVEITVPYEL